MATRPFIYSGKGFSLQRGKGRFVLPTQFRSTVRASSGAPIVCLAKHDRWECLTGFGLSRVEEFDQLIRDEQALAVQKGEPYDPEKRAHELYGFFEVPFDDSGRFVMPEDLASLANIVDQLYFSGAGRFFTAWNPAELDKMDKSWAPAQTSCRSLAARELAKAKRQ